MGPDNGAPEVGGDVVAMQRTIADLRAQLGDAQRASTVLEAQLLQLTQGSTQSAEFSCLLPVPPLDLSTVCLTPEEEERLGGRGSVQGLASNAKGRLPGVTAASVAAGAERADLKVVLAVVDTFDAGDERAIYGPYGRTLVYTSPAFRTMVDAPSAEEAIRRVTSSVSSNTAIRASLAGFMKLMLLGREVVPCLVRNVVFHDHRAGDLTGFWFYPVLVFDDPGAEGARPGGGEGDGVRPAGAPRLGIMLFTEGVSAARQFEGMLRDHMGLKYTPNPITMVNEEGFIMTQNPASACAIGIQGYEMRMIGSTRFNYLTQLFMSDPTAEQDMRACTATGRSWSRRLRISDSPILRTWLELEEGEERWHEVQVSRLRDPLYTAASCYIVAEQDVTATVLAQERVARLQRQQHALLSEILPPQVIEVFMAAAKGRRVDVRGVMEAEDVTRDGDGSGSDSSRSSSFSSGRGKDPTAVWNAARTGAGDSLDPGTPTAALPAGLGADASPTVGQIAEFSAAAAEREAPSSDLRTFSNGGEGVSDTGAVVLPDGTLLSLRVDSDNDNESGSAVQISRRDVMSLATWHESATILFADIKGFTSLSQQLHPAKVMLFLDTLYNAFDMLLDECGVYKVETIGDCYMVSAGLFATPCATPDGSTEMRLGGHDPKHAAKVLRFARQMMAMASRLRTPLGDAVEIRIGMHSGPCMSGVVGRRMPRFCLFGDTINVASRMESTGQPGRIHVSEATRELLPDDLFETRGEGIEVKGVGLMKTHWWTGDLAQQCTIARDRILNTIAGVMPPRSGRSGRRA